MRIDAGYGRERFLQCRKPGAPSDVSTVVRTLPAALEGLMSMGENGDAESIAVYKFSICDRSNGAFVEHAAMATETAIRRLKGMADLQSKRLVWRDDVDCEGFWREPRGLTA
jgi:hypothetical protein